MKEAARSKLASEFPARPVDQAAETRHELLKQWPMGTTAFDKFVRNKLDSGEWERVWKEIGGKLRPAYRRASTGFRNVSKPRT